MAAEQNITTKLDAIVVKLEHIRAAADLVNTWADENRDEIFGVFKHTIPGAMDVIITATEAAEDIIAPQRAKDFCDESVKAAYKAEN